jgi:hypothetical protein
MPWQQGITQHQKMGYLTFTFKKCKASFLLEKAHLGLSFFLMNTKLFQSF